MWSEQQPKSAPVKTAHGEPGFKTKALFKAKISKSTITNELETLLSTRKQYSPGSCTNSKAEVFYRSLSCCYSNTRARFCTPLFKHQSKGVKAGQRKTCGIRSCDMAKKIPLSMKGTLFSNTFHKVSSSFSPSAYKMRLLLFSLRVGLTAPKLPVPPLHASLREDPSLTETATH